MEYLKNPILLWSAIGVLLLTTIGVGVYFYYNPNIEEKIVYECDEEIIASEEEEETPQYLTVDIKGYVNNPGVYELTEGSTVNDLVNMAGGLKYGGTTKNLNLSKKLVDEALVIVTSTYLLNKKEECTCPSEVANETSKTTSTNEIKSFAEEDTNFALALPDTSSSSDKNNDTSSSSESKLVNINTASLSELMTISGIGESKAKKIIEYREKTPFTSIEDIKNVSGIGDNLFESIKNDITV